MGSGYWRIAAYWPQGFALALGGCLAAFAMLCPPWRKPSLVGSLILLGFSVARWAIYPAAKFFVHRPFFPWFLLWGTCLASALPLLLRARHVLSLQNQDEDQNFLFGVCLLHSVFAELGAAAIIVLLY